MFSSFALTFLLAFVGSKGLETVLDDFHCHASDFALYACALNGGQKRVPATVRLGRKRRHGSLLDFLRKRDSRSLRGRHAFSKTKLNENKTNWGGGAVDELGIDFGRARGRRQGESAWFVSHTDRSRDGRVGFRPVSARVVENA